MSQNHRPTGTRSFVIIWVGQLVSTLGSGLSRALLQRKIDLDAQGRVFSVGGIIAMTFEAVSYPIAGTLADTVAEPLMAEGGALAGIFGPIIGTGPGRGMGLIILLMGVGIVLCAAAAYLYPHLRLVEDELPDAIVDEDEPVSDIPQAMDL